MPRIVFRGHQLDTRTARMVEAAEKIGGALRLTQGAYNGGGVAASGGTHDGGGVSDFSVKGLTRKQVNRRVRALRLVGFAAWHRTPEEGPWGAHIHAVAVGCEDLSPVAARQITALRHGRNGLRSNRLDRHRGMKLPVTTFERYLASLRVPRPTLKRGDTGPAVKALQKLLGVTVDGDFGPQTEAAVNKAKRAAGGPADGLAGPNTWARLEGRR